MTELAHIEAVFEDGESDEGMLQRTWTIARDDLDRFFTDILARHWNPGIDPITRKSQLMVISIYAYELVLVRTLDWTPTYVLQPGVLLKKWKVGSSQALKEQP